MGLFSKCTEEGAANRSSPSCPGGKSPSLPTGVCSLLWGPFSGPFSLGGQQVCKESHSDSGGGDNCCAEEGQGDPGGPHGGEQRKVRVPCGVLWRGSRGRLG